VRVDEGGPGLEGVVRSLTLTAGLTLELPGGETTAVPLGHVRALVPVD
jgi:hypothetical protein